ncbi:type I-F CRISPR-associated helicase Cas3f [Dethiosulfatarculus sandiegensis]|uniref:Helicase n=1 Tax=Dethiosulfatarculus sandiegensis TaxID=1429043 RepID=A0A0D2K1I4_9BACT|nr:type I-F CRISPR-associated helicase Cas3f [Dethiosulfatarculus sandiegensis]KIX15505.1 helicase [Dethiosulfatarculus sandiegensis]
MNVILISECRKNALKQTRRIIDQFAERRGRRTWQTAITAQGLETLRSLLKKTARKNTAVACHWIRGRNQSELLWIVGDASRFNSQGACPTNTTSRPLLAAYAENDWHTLEIIRLLAAMAALFHDFGKAVRAFQQKLKLSKPRADALRHEWVSLRIFQAFVGKDDDHAWLSRLAGSQEPPDLSWLDQVQQDGLCATLKPFKSLPPMAKCVAWLIVSHHRLPVDFSKEKKRIIIKELNRLPAAIAPGWNGARLDFDDLDKKEAQKAQKNLADCWALAGSISMTSPAWQKRAKKLARRMLSHEVLFKGDWLDDPYVMHLSRLVLMLSDHYYSSLKDPRLRVQGQAGETLYANTIRQTGELNQFLDEHLIGVETNTGLITHALPRLDHNLPRIARHKGFKKRSSIRKFKWQDKAHDLACALAEASREHGFFGINMASTGCGKTLANGRIIYGLSDQEKGARFTIALGLRTLTMQTGEALRQRLGLAQDVLAVLVGGSAVRELYERKKRQNRDSESDRDLLPENTYVQFEGSLDSGPLKTWLKNTRGASALLSAPVLVCTIDHLMPATEGLRGGRQIAPMLRLLTSDLILDEPDDFGIEDLPALTRLVHWSGLLGGRVLLSSATLPPALVEGLFSAYCQGRAVFQKNRGIPGLPLKVCCAWFDEYESRSGEFSQSEEFMIRHEAWVDKRVENLSKKSEPRRIGRIVSLKLEKPEPEERQNNPSAQDQTDPEDLMERLARINLEYAQELHANYHTLDKKSSKRVSFGLIRLAHIDNLFDLTRAIAQKGPKPGTRLHLCCYHSRFPLAVRSRIEFFLDEVLNRHDPEKVFKAPWLRAILANSLEEDHLFVVLASPVAEVGRDHDYDWAIVEPSSLRSIIQLAGRVWRHRALICRFPNIYIWETNLTHLKKGLQEPAFTRPGFENKNGFMLKSHDLNGLLTKEQYTPISSIPRISSRNPLDPQNNLADLEHEHIKAVMVRDPEKRLLTVNHWWSTRAHLSGEMQRAKPFRYDPFPRVPYAIIPDADTEEPGFCELLRDGGINRVNNLFHEAELTLAPNVSLWNSYDFMDLLPDMAEETQMDPAVCARRFGRFELPEEKENLNWFYNPALGLRRQK